jgi:hypothetical protein
MRRRTSGSRSCDPIREFDQSGAALLERILEPAAFAVAEARELEQRFAEQCVRSLEHRRHVA